MTADPKDNGEENQDKKATEPSLSQAYETLLEIKENLSHKEEPSKKSIFSWLSELLSVIQKLVLLVVFIFICYVIYHESKREVVIIEPFEVPEQLSKQGLTGRTFANKLMDQMEIIVRESNINTSIKEVPIKEEKHSVEGVPLVGDRQSSDRVSGEVRLTEARHSLEGKKEFSLSGHEQSLDFNVPGVGVSLKSIIYYIKKNILRKEPLTISGEIFIQDSRLSITTRISGKPHENLAPLEMANMEKELDKGLLKAAQYIYKQIQPITLAYFYQFNNDKKAFDETIDYVTRNGKPEEQALAYTLRGISLYKTEDYKTAIEMYKKAIELDSNFASAYYNWGLALYYQKDYQGAIEKYSKAAELDPNYASAYYNWGNALSDQKDYKGAIEKFQKVAELDPHGELGRTAREMIDELTRK